MNKKFLLLLVFFLVILFGIAIFWYFFQKNLIRFFYLPTKTSLEKGGNIIPKESKEKDIEIVAENLQIPWEIAFLPSGEILVTERPGTLEKIKISALEPFDNTQVFDSEAQTRGGDASGIGKIIPIEGVHHIGEGGLLGLALHPQFEKNQWIYLYLTTKKDDSLLNRVERYSLKEDKLFDRKIIIDGIPGAVIHDGGRIAFGPDGFLYITTGDAGKPESAQDINSLAGKILRITDEGEIPSDNPFSNAVYSYGHRNSQGIAWDNKGRLWATEHGRSGILSGLDEINLIEKGVNYGWPLIQGDEKKEGMRTPKVNSGPDETWAPAGAIFWKGRIFFTGLRGESLYEAKILETGNIEYLKAHFGETFGRLRAIALGPDGKFYLSTSNTDGRGTQRTGDDKIVKIDPEVFFPN